MSDNDLIMMILPLRQENLQANRKPPIAVT